jgi:hypothetical protein
MNKDSYDYDSEGMQAGNSVERVGDITGEPATNEAVDTYEASKIASLLQGLTFPANKGQIKEYITDNKSISVSNESVRDISQFIENNLPGGKEYSSVYEIEKSLGLVVKKNEGDKKIREKNKRENKAEHVVKKEDDKGMPPYARDKALNEANRRRLGEKARPDPYSTGKT